MKVFDLDPTDTLSRVLGPKLVPRLPVAFGPNKIKCVVISIESLMQSPRHSPKVSLGAAK